MPSRKGVFCTLLSRSSHHLCTVWVVQYYCWATPRTLAGNTQKVHISVNMFTKMCTFYVLGTHLTCFYAKFRPSRTRLPRRRTTEEPANNPRTPPQRKTQLTSTLLNVIRPRKKHQPTLPPRNTETQKDKNRGTIKKRGATSKKGALDHGRGSKYTTPKNDGTHGGTDRYSLSANHRTSHSTCSILCATLSHRGSRFVQRKYAAGTPHAANMAAKGYGASASKVGFHGVVEVKKP